MNLLFVIDNLNSGGAQRQMVTLAVGLKARGHHVDFYLYGPGDHFKPQLQAAGIEIFQHIKRSRYSLDVFWTLRQQISSRAYDLILSFLPTPNFYNAITTQSLSRKPVVVVSERFCDPPEGVPLKDTLVRQVYRMTDYITVNSRHQHDNFLKHYPWMNGRIATIYNGLDTEHFHPPDIEPPDSPFKILCIGSISPFKNGLLLIWALAILRDKYGICPQVSWVGQHIMSIASRKEYSERMNQEIANLQLHNQWNWLYQRHDIAALLQGHHVFVHPSYFEGLPNAVCEALACGRPVLVSNTLDHPYLVQDGESGFLFDWQSPDDLAIKIKQIYDCSPQERHAMGLKGARFAREHLSLNRLVNDYEQLFLSLIAKDA